MDLSGVLPSLRYLRCLTRQPYYIVQQATTLLPEQVPAGAPGPHNAGSGAHTGAPARAPAAAAPAAAHVRPRRGCPFASESVTLS